MQKTVDTDVKAKLTNLVRVAVERAESLKGIKTTNDNSVMKSLAELPSVPETNFPNTEQSIQLEQSVNVPSVAPGNINNILQRQKAYMRETSIYLLFE